MISEEMFKYYTTQEFTVNSAELVGINGEDIDRINDLAEETVEKREKVLTAEAFKSNGEYQLYLLAVSQFAWAEWLGAEVEDYIID